VGKQYYSLTNFIQTNKPCPVCKADRLRHPLLDCMLLRYDFDTFTYYCGYCDFTLNIGEAVHALQQIFSARTEALEAMLRQCKSILEQSQALKQQIEELINGKP
jgi:hypothetical protein